MEIEEIKDEDSLRAWLESQNSYKVSVSVAARAALRVYPVGRAFLTAANLREQRDLVPTIWALLTSAVLSVKTSPELVRAAKSAVETSRSFGAAARSASHAAAAAASSPGYATYAAANGTATGLTVIEKGPEGTTKGEPELLRASQVWQSVQSDCRRLIAGGSVWDVPLWPSKAMFAEEWQETELAWRGLGRPWHFFARIYDDFWHGREPDWDYIERIVLIDPDIWEAGPDAVAQAIEIIDQQQRLAGLANAQLEKLHIVRVTRSSNYSPGLGHNNPPESISDETNREVLEAGAKAECALEELAEELAKTDPSSERLDESSNRLLKALSIVAKYCGQKLDLAVDTLIKWGIPVGGAWLVANYTELSALANGAKALAKLIGG